MTDEPLSAYVERAWTPRDKEERAQKQLAITGIRALETQHAHAMAAIERALEFNQASLARLQAKPTSSNPR